MDNNLKIKYFILGFAKFLTLFTKLANYIIAYNRKT